MEKFKVVIKDNQGKVVQELESTESLRAAERMERGININLNHKEYHTEIIKLNS
jgi:hypothetical protein